jgi:hypothetical protein
MPITPEQAAGMVDTLAKELSNRRTAIDKHDSYYDGKHPLQFASEQFRKAFGGLFDSFSDNWCGVVVDSKAELLEVTGFIADGAREDDRATWDLWRKHELDSESNGAFVDALVSGRVFGLAWEGPEGEEITFEHASQAIVGYAPGSRRRVAGLKCWSDDTTEYATLYTVDELWKFERPRQKTASGMYVSTFGDGRWKQREIDGETWPLPHSLGAVPLVEIPNRKRLRAEPSSEIASVVPMQDAVNLLWSHLITASDFAAFPQRVVLGAEQPMEQVYDKDGNIVGEKPVPIERFRQGRITWLEEPDAKIAEWGAADLSNYAKVIELAVEHIASQTSTPPEYMLSTQRVATTDSRIRLSAAARERQSAFQGGIRELMRLGHLAAGDEAAAAAITRGTVEWRDTEVRSASELADALMKMKALGVPDEEIWKRLGADQTEIERWKAMQADSVSRALGGDLASVFAGVKPEPSATPP